MTLPNYDYTKTLGQNVKELFKYVNYNYREMTMGRVPQTTEATTQNANDLLLAEQEITDKDIALIEAEQNLTDLDIRVMELEAKEN